MGPFAPGEVPHLDWTKHASGLDHDEAVVIVDQIEELFTLCSDETARAQFLARMQNWSGPVVLGLRADFSDRAFEYPLLVRALRECQIIVEPMLPAHLRTIITRPAQTTGLVLQDGFVDLLLRDTEAESGVSPLPSHTGRTRLAGAGGGVGNLGDELGPFFGGDRIAGGGADRGHRVVRVGEPETEDVVASGGGQQLSGVAVEDRE